MSLPQIIDKYPSYVLEAEKRRAKKLAMLDEEDAQDLRAQLENKDPYLAQLYDRAVAAVKAQTSGEFWRFSPTVTGVELAMAFMRSLDAKAIDESGLKGLIAATKGYYALTQRADVQKPAEIYSPPIKQPEQTLEPKTGYEGLYEARSFVVAQDMQQKALSAIQTTLMNQFAAGATMRDAIKALDGTFAALAAGQLISPGTPGYDYTKPAIQETTVRTLYNDAMNGGRNDVYESNAGFVAGTERSEVLDSRNHPLSPIVDGLKIRLSDPRRRRLTGSLHFNDRGVDIPITAIDAQAPGFQWSSDSEIDNAISQGQKLSPRFF